MKARRSGPTADNRVPPGGLGTAHAFKLRAKDRVLLESALQMLLGIGIALGWCETVGAIAPAPMREQIEADWSRQDEVRNPQSNVTPQEDAAGACDGLKNGRWGFHTALEENPWWQVDLGRALRIDRLSLFNRCDGT